MKGWLIRVMGIQPFVASKSNAINVIPHMDIYISARKQSSDV